MIGQPGWVVSPPHYIGSSVTFVGIDGPAVAVGVSMLPQLLAQQGPIVVEHPVGSVSVSLYGQSASLAYVLTADALPASIANPSVVNKTGDDSFNQTSASIEAPVHSITITDSGQTLSIFEPSTELEEFVERPLDGLADLLSWREVFSGTLQTPGQPNKLWNVGDAAPQTSGYYFANTLSFDGSSLLMLTAGSNPLWGYAVPLTIECVAAGNPNDEQLPESAYWTATAFRPRDGVGMPSDDPPITFGATGPTGTSLPYCKGRIVSIQPLPTGVQYAFLRNGEVALPLTQSPSRQQLYDATEQDGSYLVTQIPTGSQIQFPTLKNFAAFVIDKKPPVVGFTAIDDLFATSLTNALSNPMRGIGHQQDGQLTNQFGTLAPCVVFATKPMASPPCPTDESANGVLPRPRYAVPLKVNGTDATSVFNSPGTYFVQPLAAHECQDLAGNNPATVFGHSWTVHALPEHHRPENNIGGHSYFGAIPKFQDPGLLTREYYRPRLPTEPLVSLRLSFDRPVNATQVNSSQLRLWKNGTLVAGCNITQEGNDSRHWVVTIPQETQDSASFFVLEYDPAGQVFTADVFPELHYSDHSQFPASLSVQDGKKFFRRVFVADDTNKRYSLQPLNTDLAVVTGYRYDEINGNPLDWNGRPYNPEPSVLVARASWLMADTQGWPRLIDTSGIMRDNIGRAASISKQGALDATRNDCVIESSGDASLCENGALDVAPFGYLPRTLPKQFFSDVGIAATAINYESFVPKMPLPGDSRTCSYWGLGTTIDPSPPAIVSPCAAPSESQWHSSAILCQNEIAQISVRLQSVNEFGVAVPPPDGGGLFSENQVVFPTDIIGRPMVGYVGHVVDNLFTRIMHLGNEQVLLDSSFQGYQLAQNLWAGVKDGVGTDIQAVAASFFRSDAQDSTRGVSEATYSIERVQSVATAWRGGKTFPALKTTTLGPLFMTVSFRAFLKAETKYEDKSQINNVWQLTAARTITDRFARDYVVSSYLTANQETDFSNGQEITLGVIDQYGLGRYAVIVQRA